MKIQEVIEVIIGWVILFILIISIALLVSTQLQSDNEPLNNEDYYCGLYDEIKPKGILIESNNKYQVLRYIEDESPLTITRIIHTYYLYVNTSLVCVNTYYDNTIEIRR